jgi:hypothetical protein
MASARPTLPMISARGSSKRGDPGGMISARSHHTQRSSNPTSALNPERFTKLKAVLVNNLLKLYHKKIGKAGDSAVYQRAVEEVEAILARGKMTEKQMKDLQRKFAQDIDVGLVGAPGTSNQPALGGMQPKPPPAPRPAGHGLAPKTQAIPGAGVQSSVPPSASGSPSKRRRHVDEWSVIVLQKDQEHLKFEQKEKDKVLKDKIRNRNVLSEQIEERRKAKENAKLQERRDAEEAKRKYDEWMAEKREAEKRRLQRIAQEREVEKQQLAQVQQMRKSEAERNLAEEQATIEMYKRQLEEDRQRTMAKIAERQSQYNEVLRDNEKNLERRRLAKQKIKEEDERLFQVQLAMAAKQEAMRAAAEAERLRKSQISERLGGEQNNRAAQMEAPPPPTHPPSY